MSLTIRPAFQELVGAQTKTLAKAWKITRRDGQVLRFTNHDRQVEIEAETYSPAGGFSPEAVRLEGSLVDSATAWAGIISSSRITIEDLMGGLYEEAQVEELWFDYRFEFLGPFARRLYWIDRVEKITEEAYEVSLSGASRYLKARVGDVATRTCRNRLGIVNPVTGIGCSVDLSVYRVNGVTVNGVLDSLRRQVIVANAAIGAVGDGYFDDGDLLWVTGANAGTVSEVQRYTALTREFVLYEPTPHPIGAGDTFDAIAGCDRLRSTCVNKFSNIEEFRGDPFIGGTDGALATPR